MNIKIFGLKVIHLLGINHIWLSCAFSFYSRIAGFLKHGDWTFINGVSIEIMEACNRKCKYCPVSTMPPRHGKMSQELFEKIINELKELGFDGVVDYSFYNEPLLDKRLVQFVAATKAKLPKSLQRIFTNGDFLTDEVYEQLTRAGMDYFIVTDHDNRPESKARFALLPKVQFQWGKDLVLTNRIGAVDIEEGEQNKAFTWVSKFLLRGCTVVSHPIIGYNGIVHLCCQDVFKTTNFGNLNEESLKDVLIRSRPVRRATSLGKFDFPLCRKCWASGLKHDENTPMN